MEAPALLAEFDALFARFGELKAGIPESVIDALRCVTKLTDDKDYAAFIEGAATNPLASAVKLADLEDNMNLLRLGELLDKDVERLRKYHRSWLRLS